MIEKIAAIALAIGLVCGFAGGSGICIVTWWKRRIWVPNHCERMYNNERERS